MCNGRYNKVSRYEMLTVFFHLFEILYILYFLGIAIEEYATTEVLAKEFIEAENDLTHMETDHEMSHVEEIIDHHDFNEVTINSEEEVDHMVFEVDCATEKFSDITDDN